jgi:FkbM family methyltransferase
MLIKKNFFIKKLRTLCLLVFNKIENNKNGNYYNNGESFIVEKLYELYSKESKKKVAFDVGANIGEYTEILSQKALEKNLDIEIHSFEPAKKAYDILISKATNKSIFLNNMGLSNQEESVDIYYDKEGSIFASLYQRNIHSHNIKLEQKEKIKLIRLDQYINEKGIPHIDFLKIDIEGHELKAFEGMGKFLNNKFVDFIQFEYGNANLDSHTTLLDFFNLFEKRGFKIAKVHTNGLELRQYSPYMDNFMYANYVAISDVFYENMKIGVSNDR